MEYPINDAGVELIKEFESFREFAYPDPASTLYKKYPKERWGFRPATDIFREIQDQGDLGVTGMSGSPWTVGWGFTKGVTATSRMTIGEADFRLAGELQEYAEKILDACNVPPNENQLSAMVSLAWNIGLGWDPHKPKPAGAKDGARNSSVMRAHNRGDVAAAARAFSLWNKAGGVVMAGLTRRRAAEAALYLKEVSQSETPANSNVDPESKLSKSPIATSGGVVAGVSTISVVAQELKVVKEALGDWAPYIIIIAAVAGIVLGGIVLYQRYKQRKEGWA